MKSFSILLELKLTALKNYFRRFSKKAPLEIIALPLFFFFSFSGRYVFFQQSFQFFKNHEPFGPLLVDETFYLFNFTVFVMLLISSAISAYTALFKSGEVPFLITRPVTWGEVYFIKLTENIWFSSWALFFIIIPFMAGYGTTKNIGLLFPLICLAFYVPFAILAGTLGTLISTLVVWFLPSRRRRMFALLIVAGLIVYGFTQTHP